MSASGVEIGSDITDLYHQGFKLSSQAKNQDKNREAWLIFRISDDFSKVIVDDSLQAPSVSKEVDEAENRAHFEQLKEAMKDDSPRFIVFDFRCVREDNGITEKIGYIYWCSDNAPSRPKMIYATTSESLKKKLSCNAEFQVNDKADFDYDEMKLKIITKK